MDARRSPGMEGLFGDCYGWSAVRAPLQEEAKDLVISSEGCSLRNSERLLNRQERGLGLAISWCEIAHNLLNLVRRNPWS